MNLKRAPTAGIKLFTPRIHGGVSEAGAIAQNAGRMYVSEDDVTLAKKLKSGRRCR